MNGAFAMTEVPVINSVLSPAEHYAGRLLAAHATATPEGVETLAELSGVVRGTVETLKGPSPALELQDDLAARLVALRDSLPEAASGLAALVDAQALEEASTIPETPLPFEAELTTDDLSAYGGLVGASLPQEDAAEQDEAARLEAERAEAERIEAERIEAERVEAERVEAERVEAERVEAERVEAERVEAERV